jgi:hypothetical protein
MTHCHGASMARTLILPLEFINGYAKKYREEET